MEKELKNGDGSSAQTRPSRFAPFLARHHPIGVVAYEKSDWRDSGWDYAAFAIGERLEGRGMRRESAPSDSASQAELIQDFGIVVGDSPFEDLRFPGICGRFKALQLLARFEGPPFAEKLRARSGMLPAQQPVHELGWCYRLDFFAKLSESQAMNAREQAAFGPFGLIGSRISKFSAQDYAAGLQSQKCFIDFRFLQRQKIRQSLRGDRAGMGDPAAHQSEQGVFA